MPQEQTRLQKLEALSKVYAQKFGRNPEELILASGFNLNGALSRMQEAIDKNDRSLLETEEPSPL